MSDIWALICDACAKGHEIKTIGVLKKPPYDCYVCKGPLPMTADGYVAGNPWLIEDFDEVMFVYLRRADGSVVARLPRRIQAPLPTAWGKD